MFTNSNDFYRFLTAGRAVFTITSKKTGTRFTYRVSRPKGADEGCPFFVGVLAGPNNQDDYMYLGFIPVADRPRAMRAGKKGRPNADSYRALQWVLWALDKGEGIPEQLELRHAGRCGRCGRELTVPESIDSGFGPECITKV